MKITFIIHLVCQYFVDCIFFFLALERRLRGKQDMQDNSATPEIAFISEKPLDYLRRHIAQRSNQIATFDLVFHHPVSSPKVQ